MQGQTNHKHANITMEKHHNEHVKSITTVRNGKIVDKTIPMKAQKPKDDSKLKSSHELDKSEPSEEFICP